MLFHAESFQANLFFCECQMSNVSLMKICRFYSLGTQGGDLGARQPMHKILVIFPALKGLKR